MERPILKEGDPFGTHRVLEPKGVLPQPALRVDNDFSRLFCGELLLHVDKLNVDAASFRQMIDARGRDDVADAVLETVAARGKQHNPVTGSGGMLLGRVAQFDPRRSDAASLAVGMKIASLVSLSLTPLRIDRITGVAHDSAQFDVEGEAVLFASAPYAKLPDDLPERLALAALDVAGAAPQVARLVRPGHVVAILGAGGKSGILCAAEARRTGGNTAFIVGVESSSSAAAELSALGLCDAVLEHDGRDAVGVRDGFLRATEGREADVTLSCVNVTDAEMSAILITRDRGCAYFFAMSTSFTKCALGAEGVGKDINLLMGNGYVKDNAESTLSLLRASPSVLALFEKRYG